MHQSMFLTPEEIADLTGRSRRDAQAKVLALMGVEHRLRPDRSIVVLRAHVEKLLGGVTADPPRLDKKKCEPNWAAMA